MNITDYIYIKTTLTPSKKPILGAGCGTSTGATTELSA
jgi:hypothetical protein